MIHSPLRTVRKISRSVFVEIIGGLGNQLFQLAFAHSLSAYGYNIIFLDANPTGQPGTITRITQLLEIDPSLTILTGWLSFCSFS